MEKVIKERYLKLMKGIKDDNSDEESNHIAADNLLCTLLEKLGYKEIVEVFESIRKWYA